MCFVNPHPQGRSPRSGFWLVCVCACLFLAKYPSCVYHLGQVVADTATPVKSHLWWQRAARISGHWEEAREPPSRGSGLTSVLPSWLLLLCSQDLIIPFNPCRPRSLLRPWPCPKESSVARGRGTPGETLLPQSHLVLKAPRTQTWDGQHALRCQHSPVRPQGRQPLSQCLRAGPRSEIQAELTTRKTFGSLGDFAIPFPPRLL